jgi:hypothetical protein
MVKEKLQTIFFSNNENDKKKTCKKSSGWTHNIMQGNCKAVE